jgi:2-iminobutanoate/2-iminopropanoate deaminase
VRQKSIDVEGLGHAGVPIPNACRVGPILATSGVGGRDPNTGTMPADPETQAVNCFDNLRRTLEAGGMDMGDVVKITVFIADESYRSAVNAPWLAHFPDAAHRPARHSLVMPLRGGMLVQLEALAVAKSAG